MKSIIIVVAIGVFVIVSGSQAFGEELTAEQKEVWEIEQREWESLKKADLESIMAYRHDKSLSLFGHDPHPLNKDQVRKSYEEWMSNAYTPTSYELKLLAINITDNIATIYYVFKWESEETGFSSKGRTMITYLKQNNKWLLLNSMSASCEKPVPCPYGW